MEMDMTIDKNTIRFIVINLDSDQFTVLDTFLQN